jgi:hypothetical protein
MVHGAELPLLTELERGLVGPRSYMTLISHDD